MLSIQIFGIRLDSPYFAHEVNKGTIIALSRVLAMDIGAEPSREVISHSKSTLVNSQVQTRLTRHNLMRNREFFLTLRQSVIEGMRRMLGEDNSITLLYSLMPSIERPVEFQRKLREVFGAACYAFEKAILEELYGKMNLRFKMQSGYQFADHVEIAARSFLNSKSLSDIQLTSSILHKSNRV